jgi:nucleotide-binding universal stress UspA family protein
MFTHVLIATDGSELAERAVKQGLELAAQIKAAVIAVTVTEPWPGAVADGVMAMSPIPEYEEAVARGASRILAAVAETAGKLGVACETVHVADRYPAEGIVELAKARNCDLIVMASHGRRGIAKLLLGSQATRVLAYSAVPVLICR